jgi:hypothetical protein
MPIVVAEPLLEETTDDPKRGIKSAQRGLIRAASIGGDRRANAGRSENRLSGTRIPQTQ